MRVYVLACALAGCTTERRSDEDAPEQPEEVPIAQGEPPGATWKPNRAARAQPLEIRMDHRQSYAVQTALASEGGGHVLFVLNGRFCATSTATGDLAAVVELPPESDWSGEVVDSEGESALVITSTGVFSLDPEVLGLDAEIELLRDRPAQTARLVDGALATLDPGPGGCALSWSDGPPTALGAACGQERLAEHDGGLLVAAAQILASTPRGSRPWLDLAASALGADPTSGVVAVVEQDTDEVVGLDPDGEPLWTSRLEPSGAEVSILGLTDGGDLGIFVVDGTRGDNRVLWMLDAETGEQLGVLDIRDSTLTVDLSGQGGVLVQVRPDSIDVWSLSR